MNVSLALQRIRIATISIGASAVVAAIATPAAFALPALPGKFSKFYTDQGIDVTKLASQSCRLCHAGVFPNGGNINAYAQDLRNTTDIRATPVDFASIEELDSDEDGATNIVEIKAGTLPGDATSKP